MPGHVRFDHLVRLSDQRGLFEHADHLRPRVEHGYCTDDNARLLVVAVRELADGGEAFGLDDLALRFVLDALDDRGKIHNRMDAGGRWTDEATTEDCWGRAVWALGTAAARHPDRRFRAAARHGFETAVRARCRWPRALAFASLGAAEVATSELGDASARRCLASALASMGPPANGRWTWPEPRLAYANATLAEARIAAGGAYGRPDIVEHGLVMLRWLLDDETLSGHLSVTPVGGRGPGDPRHTFDQQPIEVAAMASACRRAEAATGDHAWREGVVAAAAWFDGANDAGHVMFDAVSGGGYDGLEAAGVNANQGAESTLAYVATMQCERSLVVRA